MTTTTEMTRNDALPIRRFLERVLADDAVADEVNDAVLMNVVQGDRDPAALAAGLSGCIHRAHDADWQEVAARLIADARELEAERGLGGAPVAAVPACVAEPQATGAAREATCARRPLRFIDHHRQRYAGTVPIAKAGEFMIGDFLKDGGVGEDGEFKVTLIELGQGGPWGLYPHLEAFGDGRGALRRAIAAGLLEALAGVESREEFARRLLAIGMVDGSDEPLPATGAEA